MSLQFRQMLFLVIAGLAAAELVAAPNVLYTATGVFDTTLISGRDIFQLAGQPFEIKVVANMASVPKTHGAHWGIYGPFKMAGTVQSRLVPTPITISNSLTNIALATGNPDYDVMQLGAPVKIVGMTIKITASITMPKGTITRAVIQPFTAPVALSPANATLAYSDETNTTVLGIASGTLNAVIGSGAVATVPGLHAAGARVISSNGEETHSAPAGPGQPIALGAMKDVAALQFYAAGVRDSGEVHVRIGGEEVPVLYAGVAGHFPGLDQVSVQLPKSLAGRGDVDVILTVDGQVARPIHIRIE